MLIDLNFLISFSFLLVDCLEASCLPQSYNEQHRSQEEQVPFEFHSKHPQLMRACAHKYFSHLYIKLLYAVMVWGAYILRYLQKYKSALYVIGACVYKFVYLQVQATLS